MRPTYCDTTPSMLNRKPKSNSISATMLPKPGNGTPNNTNFTASTPIVRIERIDSVIPDSVISWSGM